MEFKKFKNVKEQIMKLFRKRAVQAEVSISKVPLKLEWSANDPLRGQCGQIRKREG